MADVAEEPIYLPAEAARYVKLSPQTVNRWRRGYSYDTLRGRRRSERLTGGSTTGRLTFTDLLEVAVLAAAKQANIKMKAIREAITAAEGLYGDRPLMNLKFQHDGRDLFVHEHESDGRGRYLNLSRRGQVAWDYIEDVLRSLDYDGEGIAYRWWPAGREWPIIIDPRVSFGRPYIHRRGVSTDAVRSRFRAGDSLSDIADDLALTEAEAEAALRFELAAAA